MKPKSRKKRKRSGKNSQIGTIRVTMGSSREEWVDTIKNSRIKNLIQHWSIPLPMLSPMGGSTSKMMSICYIGWKEIAVYLRICLKINYRISWLCTCKFRNGIWVTGLVSWINRELFLIWRRFSLFFTPINCIVVVTSQRRWCSTYTRDSRTWRRITRSMERMSSTTIMPRLDR